MLRISHSGVVTAVAGTGAPAAGLGGRSHPGGRPVGGGRLDGGSSPPTVTTSPSRCGRWVGIPTCSSTTRGPCGGCSGPALGPDRPARGAVRVGRRRVLLLRWLRAPGGAVRLLVGPEHREAVPAPVPVVRAAGPAPGGRGLHVQHRGGPDPPEEGSPREWALLPLGVDVDRFRAPDRRATGRHPFGSGSSVVSSPTRESTSSSRRWPSTTGLSAEIVGAGPESDRLAAMADALGIRDRVTLPRPRRRGPDPRRLPPVRRGRRAVGARCPAGSSSSAGWWSRPRRRGSRWWPAPAAPSPTWSVTPACWSRPATPLALRAALSRFLDEPGLWTRLRAGRAGRGGPLLVEEHRRHPDGPLPGRHLRTLGGSRAPADRSRTRPTARGPWATAAPQVDATRCDDRPLTAGPVRPITCP